MRLLAWLDGEVLVDRGGLVGVVLLIWSPWLPGLLTALFAGVGFALVARSLWRDARRRRRRKLPT